MQKYRNKNDKIKNNIVICDGVFENSTITFKEDVENSIVYISEGLHLVNTKIRVCGNDSLVFLDKNNKNTRRHCFDLIIHENSTFYYGKNSSIAPYKKLKAEIASDTNIVIGNDAMIADGCEMITSDYHLILDQNTGNRLNYNKSIYIGDHVWLGRHVTITKGSIIGSGSVLGINSNVFGKKIDSNCIFGGSEIKKIRDEITWDREKILKKENKKEKENKKFIYEYNEKFENFIPKLDKKLISSNASEKLNILQNLSQNKNRFYYKTKKKNIFNIIRRKK